ASLTTSAAGSGMTDAGRPLAVSSVMAAGAASANAPRSVRARIAPTSPGSGWRYIASEAITVACGSPRPAVGHEARGRVESPERTSFRYVGAFDYEGSEVSVYARAPATTTMRARAPSGFARSGSSRSSPPFGELLFRIAYGSTSHSQGAGG